jgi:hypothetical protein
MPVLLVDDRDGRVVDELENQDEALRVLEALARDDINIPEWYCLVELDSRHGAIVGMDTSVTIRPLPHE